MESRIVYLTDREQTGTVEPDRPSRLEQIEVTPEMIAAGLRFLHDAGFPSLRVRAESPQFVEDFLMFCIDGGCSRKGAFSSSA